MLLQPSQSRWPWGRGHDKEKGRVLISNHVCRLSNAWIDVDQCPDILIFTRLGIREIGWGYRFNPLGIKEKKVVDIVLKDSWLFFEKTFDQNVV